MKVIREGHLYELEMFEDKSGRYDQSLQFIEKVPTGINNELRTEFDGTTNEEVLKVLINRMEYLQNKFPCEENEMTISCLYESLYWLEKRTKDRLQRNVEGKQMK